MPGVRATALRGFRRRHWVAGRAIQLGSPGAVVTRDGIADERTVPRASFYRNNDPWFLIR